MFTKESLERLREKVDLVELLSSYIDLKRAGATYKGCCPFHEERTPSFIIQRSDHHYHCFGCGAHGDAIQFLMNYLNLPFREAVETLAERFQVVLEEKDKEKEESVNNKEGLKEALEAANQFFHFFLLYTEAGREAREYLYGRGINLDFLKRFSIGLAPASSDLFCLAMQKLAISEENLLQTGLINERHLAFFQDRITFPIRANFGNVIGFSARKYKEETFGGKYINTQETPLFKKSKILFGLDLSRRRIAKERTAIIVEGQIDCLRLIDAGLDMTVAALGTAFGEAHVALMAKLGVRLVYLMFDSDEAGCKAALKVGDLFQKIAIEVKVVTLPEGQDPDTFVQKEGVEKLQHLMDKSEDYLTFVVSYLARQTNLNSPAEKNRIVSELSRQIKGWNEQVMVHESLKQLARLLHVPEEMVGVTGAPSPKIVKEKIEPLDATRVLELDLLRWLIIYGAEKKEFASIAKANLTPDHFQTEICRKMFTTYLNLAEGERQPDILSLMIDADESQAELLFEEIMHKRINPKRASEQFAATVQKLMDRKWLSDREKIQNQLSELGKGEEEILLLAKTFDTLGKNRPKLK